MSDLIKLFEIFFPIIIALLVVNVAIYLVEKMMSLFLQETYKKQEPSANFISYDDDYDDDYYDGQKIEIPFYPRRRDKNDPLFDEV